MNAPDLLSYLVAAHVFTATPGVQLRERGAAARIVEAMAVTVGKRVRRMRAWRAAA